MLTAVVQRAGVVLVRASVELSDLGNPDELPQPIPYYNLKLIPSVKEHERPGVAQLTSTELENVVVRHVYRGKVTI